MSEIVLEIRVFFFIKSFFSCHTVIALIFVDVSRVSRLSWGTSFMKIFFSFNGFVCFLALLFSSLLA